jgi:hypothetical protein
MTERPTVSWRQSLAEEETALHFGPPAFIAAVDSALEAYEKRVEGFENSGDKEIWTAVEQVVRALNAADEKHGVIETTIREDLCEYIDAVLTEADIDVEALATRHGIDPSALTDKWRDW